jgi:hypothetical protein
MKRKKKLYMLVTKDEFELPLVVESSKAALERKLGLKSGTVNIELWRYRNGQIKNCRYREVETEE